MYCEYETHNREAVEQIKQFFLLIELEFIMDNVRKFVELIIHLCIPILLKRKTSLLIQNILLTYCTYVHMFGNDILIFNYRTVSS